MQKLGKAMVTACMLVIFTHSLQACARPEAQPPEPGSFVAEDGTTVYEGYNPGYGAGQQQSRNQYYYDYNGYDSGYNDGYQAGRDAAMNGYEPSNGGKNLNDAYNLYDVHKDSDSIGGFPDLDEDYFPIYYYD